MDSLANGGTNDEASVEVHPVFLCPICIDRMNSPQMLNCQHSICKKCLQQYVASNDYKDQLPCPTCRQKTLLPSPGGVRGAEKLPTNHVLNSLLDAFQHRTTGRGTSGGGSSNSSAAAVSSPHSCDTPCDPCRDEGSVVAASVRCLECADNLCDLCVARHRRNRRLQRDRLVPIGDGRQRSSCSGGRDSAPALLPPTASSGQQMLAQHAAVAASQTADSAVASETKPCVRHPKERVQLYCTECERLACLLCKLSHCERHRCMPLDGCTDETRTRFRAAQQRVEEKAAAVRTRLQTAGEARTAAAARFRDARDELERQRVQAQRCLDAAYQRAAARVDEAARLADKRYESFADACQTLASSLDSFGEHLTSLLASSAPVNGALNQQPPPQPCSAPSGKLPCSTPPPLPKSSSTSLLEAKPLVESQLVSLMAADVPDERPADVYVEQPTLADYENLCGSLFNVFYSAPPAGSGSRSIDDDPVVPPRGSSDVATGGTSTTTGSDDDDHAPSTWRKAFGIDCHAYRMAFDRHGNMYVAYTGGLMMIKTMLEDGEVYDVAAAGDGRLLVVRRSGEKWKLRCYAPAAAVGGGEQLAKRWSNRVRDNFGYLATVDDRVLLAEGDHIAVYRLSDGHLMRTIRRAPSAQGGGSSSEGAALVVDPLHVSVNPVYGHVLVTEPASLSVKAITERCTHWVYEDPFCSPSGVCVDSRGHVYVSDEMNHRILHLSPFGEMRHVISVQSPIDRFENPSHIAIHGREKMAVKVNVQGSRQKKVLVLVKKA